MKDERIIFKEVKNFYQIVPLKEFRRTKGVAFDIVPMSFMPRIDGIDRVIHDHGATSPGKTEGVERPWYMHPAQSDNLIVLTGTRYVDIYTKEHGKVESFEVSANLVKQGGDVIYEGPVMLVWSTGVFHRIKSGQNGSASLNFAVRYEGFDIRTNFNIYDLNTETGDFKLLREGHLDQM